MAVASTLSPGRSPAAAGARPEHPGSAGGAPAEPDLRSRIYLWLCALFVTCLLVADLTGPKFFHFELFRVGGYVFVTHSVGMLSFPVVFLLTDLLNEYYGRKGARRVTWIAAGCAVLASLLVFAARKMPADAGSPIPQPAFEAVFAQSNRLYLASLTAFVAGQLADIWVFDRVKRATSGRLVWLRATGSTVISQALDSLLVSSILLYGAARPDGRAWTPAAILEVAATGYVLKFLIAIALTPLIYLGRWLLHARAGLRPLPA